MRAMHIATPDNFELPLTALVGESVAVLGIKGSGKTNTAAVLIEELLAQSLPLTIVDIEGEYWGLRERFEIVVAGRSRNVDLEVSPEQAGAIARFSLLNSVSVILDLSEFSQDDMMRFLLKYFKALWDASFDVRKPYEIVLEEAHEFVPQGIRTPLKEVITRIALRGRKRGLGIIAVSQRSAKVEKDVLTQAAILFLHRVVHPIDVKVYQDILPLPPRDVESMLGRLKPGQVIVLKDYQAAVIQVRLRYTYHVGATPELSPSSTPRLRKVGAALLKELRQALSHETAEDDAEHLTIKSLQVQLDEKNAEIERLRTTIEKLQEQIGLLSKLEVSMNEHFVTPEALRLSAVEVQQMHAETLSTGSKSIAQVPTVMLVEKSDSAVVVSATEPDAVAKQKRRFEILVQDLMKLPRFHRLILKYLLQREDAAVTAKELGRWLNLSEDTIRNRPPLELIKMGLINRSGKRGEFRYSSSFHRLKRIQYPNLSEDQLVEEIIHRC